MYKVSAKRQDTGKYWGFGKISKNDYGNLRLSFKKTPELMEFINGCNEWVNFSLFEDKPKEEPLHRQPTMTPPIDDDQDLPF